MSTFRIRKAGPGDNAALARIIREVFEEHDAPRTGTVYSDPATDHLYELFREPGSVLWVAEEHGVQLGLCGVFPTPGLEPGTAELVKFYLAAPARGKGIGRALLEQCFRSARELGYRRLYIESLPVFSKAVRIYEGLGFVRIPAPLGNSGHTSCDIWMLKELGHEDGIS